MKDKLGKQILKNSILYCIYVFLLEMIVRLNTSSHFFDAAVIRIMLSSIIIGLVCGLITSLFNYKAKKIVITVISAMMMIYTWVEINLFTYMGFFMGVGNAEQGTKITDYIKDFIGASTFRSYLVVIPFIILMLFVWWLFKVFRMKKLEKTVYFIFKRENKLTRTLAILYSLLALTILVCTYYSTLRLSFLQNKHQAIKNTTLFLTSDNSNLSVSQFGVFAYGFSDVVVNLFNIDVSLDDIDDSGVINSTNNSSNNSQVDNKRVIDDTYWQEVINNSTDKTFNKLNNYFINRKITPKNEYTGIFEGKNLIVILMESTNEIFINEKEYPTLYKLYNEGFSFRNNYSPRNNCSTGNNEMTSMTSLFTINNTCTANTYKNNVYPQAIFNIFNNKGYMTSSYHDYAEYYYARRTIHPNMGSMVYRNVNELKIPWSSVYEEWPSDVDLVKNASPYFINQDKFMVYLTSVTPHQPYTVSSENGNKHLSEFDDYNYSTPVKRYMSKLKELDAALKELLDTLEANGKLDDTVIALFADHYPYGLTTKQINTVLPYDVTVNNEVDRTPMVIYNSAVKGEKIEKYTSILDLLPTLLNMFNMDYDPRFYLGTDIFSSDGGRTVFADGSWQDEIGYYSATSGVFKNSGEATYTSEELLSINTEIQTRQKMSAIAIKTDYFNKLFKEINKIKEKYDNIDASESEGVND